MAQIGPSLLAAGQDKGPATGTEMVVRHPASRDDEAWTIGSAFADLLGTARAYH